jgi:hypothetical protein
MASEKFDDFIIRDHLCRVRNRRGNGRDYVEVLVYKGTTRESELVAEWEMPHTFRYSHHLVAQIAEAQTEFGPDLTA